MFRMRWIVVSFAMLSLAAFAPAQIQQSETPHQEHQTAGANAEVQKPDMMSRCQEMMAQQQQMAERKKQMNQKLDVLVREMNQAERNDQPAKIIAVINEMVVQRQAMDQMTTMMQQHMMMHAMDHAQSGMTMDCPMMKQMQEKMNPVGGGKP